MNRAGLALALVGALRSHASQRNTKNARLARNSTKTCPKSLRKSHPEGWEGAATDGSY